MAAAVEVGYHRAVDISGGLEDGIDVVADLPGVGANLHDHPISGIVYRSRPPVPAGVNNHGEALGLIRSSAGLDEDAVVDTELRVHGISGLRVADAWVVPTPVSANTNATVYAIAGRAAALIRGT